MKNIDPLWPPSGPKTGDSYAIDGIPIDWHF